jgi:hypothetical protein
MGFIDLRGNGEELGKMTMRRSFILFYTVFFVSVSLILASFVVALVSSRLDITKDDYLRQKSEWASEAGIEWTKAKLAGNHAWYTDPSDPSSDDIKWLASAAGYQLKIPGASFKVVREEGVNVIYSVGYTGDSIENGRSICAIKVKYENPPFRQLSWERI